MRQGRKPLSGQVAAPVAEAYAAGREDERDAAIEYFEKVARETDDQSPLGKAHWCRSAAQALREGWHSAAPASCAHEWKVTSQRAHGMWCKCAQCGATKEETWD